MSTSAVAALCFLTFALFVAGIHAQDNSACNVANCNKCTGEGACVECNRYTGYTINNRVSPSRCDRVCDSIGGCLLCDSGVCRQCMNYFALSADQSRCERCSDYDNCVECTITSCTRCNNTLTHGPIAGSRSCGRCGENAIKCSKNGAGFADACADGNPTPVDGHCVCADNCISCFKSGWTRCDTCKPGYGLTKGNECQKCPAYCATCNGVDSGKCETCNAGYMLSADATACTQSASCTPNPCVNGKCRSKSDSIECKCNPGFSGPTCAVKDNK